MQNSLRKVLIDSHVAAITIAILLALSLSTAFVALWGFVDGVLYILAVEAYSFAHLNLAYATHFMLYEELNNLPVTLAILFSALVCMLTAWLLSRWTFGVGPLRTLGSYRDKLSRKTHG